MPGGSLISKPMWWSAFGHSTTSAFFIAAVFYDACSMLREKP